tara:strand:+ start:610 stop:1311 length:702 start_codon:yes stop_codon:yes gene_type:complete
MYTEHRSRYERSKEMLLDELCDHLGFGVRGMLAPCSPDTLRNLRDFYLRELERTKAWARSETARPDSSGLEKKYSDEEEERVDSLALDPDVRSALAPLIDALNSPHPDRAAAQAALDQLNGLPLSIDHLFILASESRLHGIGHMVGGRAKSKRGTSSKKLCLLGKLETQVREEYAASGKPRPKQKEIADRIHKKGVGLEYDTILKYLGPKYAKDRHSIACSEILESRDSWFRE